MNTWDLFLTPSSGQTLFSASWQPLALSGLWPRVTLSLGVNKYPPASLAGLAEEVSAPSWAAYNLKASSVPGEFCVGSDPLQPGLT